MPKHNNESIYGLDRNLTFNDRLFGSDGDNNKKSSNFRVGDLAQLIINTFGNAFSNAILTGGATWISGLTYEVSPLTYFINSTFYSATGGQVVLTSADPNDSRIDIITVNANGTLNVITGTPSPNPIKPELPNGQLEITFVLVEANATEPSGIVEVLAYNENVGQPTEWAPSQINSTAFNFASLSNPFRDSNSILFTHVANEVNRELALTSATALTSGEYSTVHFYIKLNTILQETDIIQLYLKDAQNERSTYIRLGNGSYGFDINNTSGYQSIIIPFSAFNVLPEQFNSLNIVIGDSVTSSFQIDYVRVIGGIAVENNFNTFLSLLDTPSSYANKADFAAIVNSAENSLSLQRIPLFEDLYGANSIITGGIIYETGLTYTVWSTAYIINGIVYFDAPISQQVTLDPADATNARIDVFAIFNDGNGNRGATVIKGIPDPNPIKPNLEDNTQVEVSFKLLQANETAPPEVTNVSIYDENVGAPTEWDALTVPVEANLDFATDPFTGTKALSLGTSAAIITLEFSSASAITYNPNNVLAFAFKADPRWNNGGRIGLRIGNNTTNIKSEQVQISRRTASNYNLDISITTWQYAYVPLSAFNFRDSAFDVLEISYLLNSEVYLDNIFIQTGTTNPNPQPSQSIWGSITGNILDQTDLVNYIASQLSSSFLQLQDVSDNSYTGKNNFVPLVTNENGLELTDINSLIPSQEGYTESGTRAGEDLIVDIGDYTGSSFFRYKRDGSEFLLGDINNLDTGGYYRFGNDLNGLEFIRSGNLQARWTGSEISRYNFASTFRTALTFPSSPTTNNIINLPESSGTVALTSDIVSSSLQAVTDIGSTTTNNIDAASFNSLSLFSQTAVDNDNIGIGNGALQNNTGINCIGIGTSALANNNQVFVSALGVAAGENNTGSQSVLIGNNSGLNNSGGTTVFVGYNSGLNNSGISAIGVGWSALENNDSNNVVGIGQSSGRFNTGQSSTFLGTNSGIKNRGQSSTSIGINSGNFNLGLNSVFLGANSGTNNEGDNNTILGYSSGGSNSFLSDTLNAQNVVTAATDVDTGLNRITLTSHGFGSNGDIKLLLYTTTGTAIGGLTNNSVYQIEIIDVNTIEFINQGLFSVGTDTHTFTPQFVYDNVTVLGANSEPTKSNQVVLGDSNVTEVKTSGTYVSGGYTVATLPTGVIGARAFVTDASVVAVGNFGTTVAGGGANTVPVFYDGTNWIIA